MGACCNFATEASGGVVVLNFISMFDPFKFAHLSRIPKRKAEMLIRSVNSPLI